MLQIGWITCGSSNDEERGIAVDSRDLGSLQATLRERIAKHQQAGIGEQDTKAALIVPVLRALGWDVEDLEDVKLEYRRRRCG